MGPVSVLPKPQSLSAWKGNSAKMTHLQAGLSPDTIEKARLELNENPDVLHQDIQQVRDMIITRPDIGFLRTDDAFILRFLRARKFHQADAFRLLAQYFQYRQLNLDMFKNFKADDPGIKRALIDGFPGVLENRDHYGRKILLLFAANWDQSSNVTEFMRPGRMVPWTYSSLSQAAQQTVNVKWGKEESYSQKWYIRILDLETQKEPCISKAIKEAG
ncbi:Clvs1 [Phodopus roborovskii]|uniref:Clvs1 protein n=1 Tax=Phodopus roborovskii TaxID=109678 RepID=A0AAU9YRH2_PHORO|nr:Clvs1 [Phodopus roborovskii]